MGQCCTSVVEAGPTLNYQWVSDSCLLSYYGADLVLGRQPVDRVGLPSQPTRGIDPMSH